MTQYITSKTKLSNSKLNELKSGIKNGTKVTFINVVGNYNHESDFVHKLLLTNTHILRLHKALANNSSANIKLSKTQLHKIGQLGGFIGRFLGPLIKTGSFLIQNVLKPLAKSVLIAVGLTVVAETDAAIHKRMFGSDCSPS